MNITNELNNWEQHQIEQYMKRQIKQAIEEMPNRDFFEHYYDYDVIVGMEQSFRKDIARDEVECGAAERFNLGEGALPRLAATYDQLFEGDWFISFIEDEVAGRAGEIDKERTDRAAFSAEKSRIANKYN